MKMVKSRVVAVDHDENGEGKYCTDKYQDTTDKDGIYDDTPGLSELIDLKLWNLLGAKARNMVKASSALSNLRPQGIEKDFWDALEESTKAEILNDVLHENNQKIIKIESERPEEVDPEVWREMFSGTRKKIVGQLYAIRPHGFDPELWGNINERNRQRIAIDQKVIRDAKDLEEAWLPAWFIEEVMPKDGHSKRSYILWWLQRITYKSRVVNFFIVGNHYIIEEPDGGMSAMALVCALILTIPFGVFSFLNDGFFANIREAIEVCPGKQTITSWTYPQMYLRTMQSFSVCLYCSMMGIIVTSVYYIFKPLPGKDMRKWCRSQGRFLLVLMFLVTLASIVGLMVLGFYLLLFSAGEFKDLCTYDVKYIYYPGLTGLLVCFFLALVCMW